MDLRVLCLCLMWACLASQASHVETEPITELMCHANEGHDKVLDTNSSEMVMLGGFHKDNMDDCILSCCNQEWKLLAREDDDLQGRCNLATFFENDDHDSVNCFLSMCKSCVFRPAEGFHFAWVHPPASNYHQSQRDKLAISNPNAISSIHKYILPLPQNLPSQKESQSDSILPPISEFHLSPWRLIKSAISWYQSPENAVQQRGKRQAGDNTAEAPKAKVEEKQLTGSENGEASPTPSSTPKQTTPTIEKQPSEQATSKPSGQSLTTTKPTGTLSTTTEDTIIITDNSITLPKSKSPSTAEKTSAKTEVTTPTAKPSTAANGESTTQKTTAAKSTKEMPSSVNSSSPTNEAEGMTPSQTQRLSTKATETPQSESKNPTTLKADSTPAAEPTTTPTALKEESASEAKATTQQQSKETTAETESTTKPATASSSSSTPKGNTEAASVTSTTPQAKESSSVTAAVDDKSATTVATDGEQQTEKYGTTEMTESKSNETVTTSDIPAKANKIFTFQTNNFILILSLALGIVLVVIVMFTLSKRWYEAYQRRHYNKVDYLINGMYS